MEDVGKISLTLHPNISLAYSPISKGYFANVWSFFFCHQKIDSSVFFRPTFLLANELVHEHAHYKFWLDHGMLEKDKDEMEQFVKSDGLENEKNALNAELSFYKKVMLSVPNSINIKLFRVKSWDSKGRPVCEGSEGQMFTGENIVLNISEIEKTINALSSKLNYDSTMVGRAAAMHSALSAVLKMDTSTNKWPIVEMKI